MAKSETVLDPMLTLRLATAMYRLAQHRIQGIGSTAWPMADGTIFDGAVQQDDLLGWATELTYSYTALGDYYLLFRNFSPRLPQKEESRSVS
jgi:hypothetical protein